MDLAIRPEHVPDDGAWHHVALVVEDQRATVYVDGKPR